jgi:hypothetical protein
MTKKRTCVSSYRKKDQYADQQAARLSGVINNMEALGRQRERVIRDEKAGQTRTLYARLSGIGARECERRAARG